LLSGIARYRSTRGFDVAVVNAFDPGGSGTSGSIVAADRGGDDTNDDTDTYTSPI